MKMHKWIATQISRLEWAERNKNEDLRIEVLSKLKWTVNKYFPSGSGFDNGTSLDLEKSTPNLLVFETAFHHMDDHGYYDRWTDHTIRVKPSFLYDMELTVSGTNHRMIKDYIADSFMTALEKEVE